MEIILHAGAHSTDDDRLLKGLLRNAEMIRHQGVAIPGPGRYRQLLRDTLNALVNSDPGAEARDILLDTILDQEPEQINRVVLSSENFFCVPRLVLGNGILYRQAEQRISGMRRLFPNDHLHLYLGLRNPATFLPAVFAETPEDDFQAFLNGADPMHLRWSDVVRRVRMEAPDVTLTIWCNEDTPLIWGMILRDMAGIAEGTKISGAFDLLSSIISQDGMQRFRQFLKEHPNINEPQKRKVMMAFLEKYALDDEMEETLDMPGWDEDYVEELTEIYEEDVTRIMEMPGVRFLAP